MQRNQAAAEELSCLTQQWDRGDGMIISKMLSLLHCLISKSVEFNHSCWWGGTGTQKQDVFLGPDPLLYQGPVRCSRPHSTSFPGKVMEFLFFSSLSSALRLRHNQRFWASGSCPLQLYCLFSRKWALSLAGLHPVGCHCPNTGRLYSVAEVPWVEADLAKSFLYSKICFTQGGKRRRELLQLGCYQRL